MLTPLTQIKGQPVQGGCVTVRSPAQLPFGAYSMVQDVRGKHPNFIKRPGQRKQHTVADGTNEVLSLYQFRKSRVDEKHFFAQFSDGDILEATNDPPIVTTGAFGSEVFGGGADQIPAAWSNHADKLIMSNGVDQHQIYCGTESYVEKFIIYRGDAAIPDIPQIGVNYSKEVRNDRSDTASLTGLGPLSAYDCVYICTPVPVVGFNFVVDSVNTNVSTAGMQYFDGMDGWSSVSGFSDGTDTGGVTLSKTGSMTFNSNNNRPKYQFDFVGFWYRLVFDAALSGEAVYIKTVTFQSEFQDVQNVWDGVAPYVVEAQVETNVGTGSFKVFGGAAIELGETVSGAKVMLACSDPIEGLYIDCGETPAAIATNMTIKYFSGTEFVDVLDGGSLDDGTNGIKNAGWVTWKEGMNWPQQHQFQSSLYAYWYEITFDRTMDASTVLSIKTMPYFDISDLGRGQCSTIWKDRGVYSFDEYPSYIYVSKAGKPLVLNGNDYGILRAGDGRNNKVTNMKSYKDLLMVWQEEKGVGGGCVTLFSGSSPANFNRTVLSTRIGTMSAKTVAVVEGVETATSETATSLEEKIATLVFFLSSHGVCVSNGYTISIISDDIQNYFDSAKDECIRRGYEDKMWLEYDSAYGVLRIGLVSGSLATKANVFPVYDLADKTWSFDNPGQQIACFMEMEAGSGNVPTLQVGGGQDDGTIYQLNYGLNDCDKSIESSIQIELNHSGEVLSLREFLIRCEAMEYGEIILEFMTNNITRLHKTVSMLPEKPGQIIKRERFGLNLADQNISIKITCGEFNTEMNLMEIGLATNVWGNR